MTLEMDVAVPGGPTLHAYDTGVSGTDRLTVLWQHGTPNVGAPPEPLFAAATRLGVRWVSYDRPGYGGSSPLPDRDVASAAGHAAAVADALGVGRFAVLGHSGGGPHALACGALLGDRILGVAAMSGPAPYGAAGLDYFAGMAADGGLRAAVAGRAAKESYEATAEFVPEVFTAADQAALQGDWSWMLGVVEAATAAGPAPLIDDDLAYVHPWGFDPADVRAPLLIVHGAQDRMVPVAHGAWLARRTGGEFWSVPEHGHVSILDRAPDALAWLVEHAG